MKFSNEDIEAIGHCLRHVIACNNRALEGHREHLAPIDFLAHQLCKDRMQRILKRIEQDASRPRAATEANT